MSEEITIKISAETVNAEDGKNENREFDIKINSNATVNDLIKKIKEHEELVEGQKYLSLEFNEKILTSNNNTNLFKTLKKHGIGNNSFLKVDLLPPGKDSKPTQPEHWVNISDDIYIKIKKPGGQQKEISLNKDKKCSELIELIKKDEDITGDNKCFLLTFGGKIITEPNNMEKTLEQLNVKDQSVIVIGFSDKLMSEKWIEISEQQEQNKEADNNTNNDKIKEGTHIETEQLGSKTSEIIDLNSANNIEKKDIEIQNNNDNQYYKCDKFGCFFKRQISLRSRLWFSFKLILYLTFVGKYPVSYKNVEFSSRTKDKIIRFFIALLLIASIPMLALGIAFLCLSILIKLAITMTAVGAFLSIIFVCSCFVISAELNSEISGKQFITLNKFPVSYNSRDSIIPIPTTENIPQKNIKDNIFN